MFSNPKKQPFIKMAALSTLVAENVEITGDIVFTGGMRIDGLVKGDVIGRDAEGQPASLLVLSDKGRIEGSIRCSDAVINGIVTGDLDVEPSPRAAVRRARARHDPLQAAADGRRRLGQRPSRQGRGRGGRRQRGRARPVARPVRRRGVGSALTRQSPVAKSRHERRHARRRRSYHRFAMDRLVDRLRSRAAQHFVGRTTELALLDQSLGVDPPPVSVFVVHGPGGVGKTSLLERARSLAAAHGIDSLRLDARDIEPTPPGFLRALGAALGLAPAHADLGGVLAGFATVPRRLILIDTFERITCLEDWLREAILAELPEATRVLIGAGPCPDRPGARIRSGARARA